MLKTQELLVGFAPRPPHQGVALDPLGALGGPQTPRPSWRYLLILRRYPQPLKLMKPLGLMLHTTSTVSLFFQFLFPTKCHD